MSKKSTSHLLLLLVAFIWGSAFVAQSKGTEFVGPFTFNFVRYALGGMALIPIVLFQNRKKPRGEEQFNTIKGGIVCGVFLFLGSTFQQMGVALTSAGKAGFITALYIVIVPLLGIVFGKKVPMKMWLCVGGAVAGFYLLCITEDFGISKGDLLVLVCAFMFSLHIMMIDRFNERNVDGVKMSCIQFFTVSVLSFVFMIILEKPIYDSIINAAPEILYAGILSSGVAYTLQIIAQKHADPTAATLILSMESVFAALAGWAILNEALNGRQIAGCVLVMIALIMAQTIPKTKESA